MARLQKKLCVRTAADIALKNKLYVSGWQMSTTLKGMRESNCGKVILAYEDGIPVGVVLKGMGSYIQVFVKKAYRLRGIGAKLVKAIQNDSGNIKGSYGVVGSKQFYAKLGVSLV